LIKIFLKSVSKINLFSIYTRNTIEIGFLIFRSTSSALTTVFRVVSSIAFHAFTDTIYVLRKGEKPSTRSIHV